MVRLAGQRVVGVGGGPVASAKLLPLAAAGADLHLVAPD
ncbi:MAG: NAD(P)-dependent oxidoreductase, partial [Egibacteraceae bacterium]